MTDNTRPQELSEDELGAVTGGAAADVANTLQQRRRKGTAATKGIASSAGANPEGIADMSGGPAKGIASTAGNNPDG